MVNLLYVHYVVVVQKVTKLMLSNKLAWRKLDICSKMLMLVCKKCYKYINSKLRLLIDIVNICKNN